MAGPEDFTGSMGNTLDDKLDRLEKMPLVQQRQFDEGLVNYMVRNQYTWQKVAFIRKTYSLLIVWLFISYLISIPFMRNPEGVVNWFGTHSFILYFAALVLFVQMAFYLTVVAFLAKGQNLMLLLYIKLMVAFPANYVWTLAYVVCFSLIVNSALAAFGFAMISCVFLYTTLAVLGLLAYTYAVKNADFKTLYAYWVPVITATLVALCLQLSGDAKSNFLEHFIGLLLSIALGWIVVYDTQLTFGAKVERGRKYPYQDRMHAMAAFEMYFDLFVHFYLGALNLFPAGQMDDPLTVQQ